MLRKSNRIKTSRRLDPVKHCLHTEPKMSQYITELAVSVNKAEESQLRAQGFHKTDVNLNEGAGGNTVFLWYKTGSCPGITRIQFSFSNEMSKGLISTGYQKVDKNLNEGACGDAIYLWYYKGKSQYDVPIMELDVTKDVEDEGLKFQFGWERLACELNRRAGGNWIYLWVKREKPTYICDITATANCDGDEHYFKNGYIRVDEDTNRGAGVPCSPAGSIFIWYRQTIDIKGAIKDLQMSTNKSEYDNFQSEGYQPVNQDLNQGTKGNEVFLWYKKEDCSKNPIKAVTVISNMAAVESYERAGLQVILKSLNAGNNGAPMYVCFYQ